MGTAALLVLCSFIVYAFAFDVPAIYAAEECYLAFSGTPGTYLSTEDFSFPSLEAGISLAVYVPSFTLGSNYTWISYATEHGCASSGIKSTNPTVDCAAEVTDCCDGGVDFRIGLQYQDRQVINLLIDVGGTHGQWSYTELPPNEWLQLVISRASDGKLTVYANGVQQHAGLTSSAHHIVSGGLLVLGASISAMQPTGDHFIGYMDDVFIMDRPFVSGVVYAGKGSTNEFNTIYGRHIRTGNESWTDTDYFATFPGAAAYWPFECGTTFTDRVHGAVMTPTGSIAATPFSPLVDEKAALSFAVTPAYQVAGGTHTVCLAPPKTAFIGYDWANLVTMEIGPASAPARPFKYYVDAGQVCADFVSTTSTDTTIRVYLEGKLVTTSSTQVPVICLDKTVFDAPETIKYNAPFQVEMELRTCDNVVYTDTTAQVAATLVTQTTETPGDLVKFGVYQFTVDNVPVNVPVLTHFILSSNDMTLPVGHELYTYNNGGTTVHALPAADLALTSVTGVGALGNNTLVTPGADGQVCFVFIDSTRSPVTLTQEQVDAYITVWSNDTIVADVTLGNDGKTCCADITFTTATFVEEWLVTPIYGNATSPQRNVYTVAHPVSKTTSKFVAPDTPLLGETVQYCFNLTDADSNPTILSPQQSVVFRVDNDPHTGIPQAADPNLVCIDSDIHSLTGFNVQVVVAGSEWASQAITFSASAKFNLTSSVYIGEKLLACLEFYNGAGKQVDPGDSEDMSMLAIFAKDGSMAAATALEVKAATINGVRVYCGQYTAPLSIPASLGIKFYGVWGSTIAQSFVTATTTLVDIPQLPTQTALTMLAPARAISGLPTPLCFNMTDSTTGALVDSYKVTDGYKVIFGISTSPDLLDGSYYSVGAPYRKEVGTICADLTANLYLGTATDGYYYADLEAQLEGDHAPAGTIVYIERTRVPLAVAGSVTANVTNGAYLDPDDPVQFTLTPLSAKSDPIVWNSGDLADVRAYDEATDITASLDGWVYTDLHTHSAYTTVAKLEPEAPGREYTPFFYFGPAKVGPIKAEAVTFVVARNISAPQSSMIATEADLYINSTVTNLCVLNRDKNGNETYKYQVAETKILVNGTVDVTAAPPVTANLTETCWAFKCSTIGNVSLSTTINGATVAAIPSNVYCAHPWPFVATSTIVVPPLVPIGEDLVVNTTLLDYFSVPRDVNASLELKINGTTVAPAETHPAVGNYTLTTPLADDAAITVRVDNNTYYPAAYTYLLRPLDTDLSNVTVPNEALVGKTFRLAMHLRSRRFNVGTPYREPAVHARLKIYGLSRGEGSSYKTIAVEGATFTVSTADYFRVSEITKDAGSVNDYTVHVVGIDAAELHFLITVDEVDFPVMVCSVDYTLGSDTSAFSFLPIVLTVLFLILLCCCVCCISFALSSLPLDRNLYLRLGESESVYNVVALLKMTVGQVVMSPWVVTENVVKLLTRRRGGRYYDF
ncbi:Concanavalin A-like lectin/glucanases superfamily [Carpediemonas membranifera]|uniref:Concanavalin A-like lectin/glucanases superfamily n=1 Tax=Carpediemonas membranifera TaxID=201153 RepID=A0A8J6ATY8_9EUKA|nr:Concanavalin A-like lectin/glucanases superfamily [Carpediemonas membranifera]|eukprot:KAG9391425.1 Concanavalin A-like lectin/glucanases superfamily [Carpediemonas membranifera]